MGSGMGWISGGQLWLGVSLERGGERSVEKGIICIG